MAVGTAEGLVNCHHIPIWVVACMLQHGHHILSSRHRCVLLVSYSLWTYLVCTGRRPHDSTMSFGMAPLQADPVAAGVNWERGVAVCQLQLWPGGCGSLECHTVLLAGD